MEITLNDSEYFADTILKRIERLLAERDNLRRELSRREDGILEHNKSFVRSFQENILSETTACERIEKLERILLMRD